MRRKPAYLKSDAPEPMQETIPSEEPITVEEPTQPTETKQETPAPVRKRTPKVTKADVDYTPEGDLKHTTLTFDEVLSMRDKLQAIDNSTKEGLGNVSYSVSNALMMMRGLAFRMQQEKVAEIKV